MFCILILVVVKSICKNALNCTLRMCTFYCMKRYLNIVDLKVKKKGRAIDSVGLKPRRLHGGGSV